MKITLYMAISIDGFITKGETDSDWVSETDWEEFYGHIKANDAVVMGRKTMEQFDSHEFPIEGVYNFVLSSNTSLHKESDNLSILDISPIDLVLTAQEKGFENLLLIGGGYTNESFLKASLIDEVVLSVHPIILGEGLNLFGTSNLTVKLNLISSKVVNSELVQLKYKVIK